MPLLLVEDDSQLRRMMTTLLEDEGYPVVAVADGVDASRYVRERRPSLVVLDLNLPHLGGHEVGARIRARYGRAVPIVLVSANEEAVGVAEALDADYVPKPFDVDELLTVVWRCLEPT